jgi:hypothetical protein
VLHHVLHHVLVTDCRKVNQGNKSHKDVEATIIHYLNSFTHSRRGVRGQSRSPTARSQTSFARASRPSTTRRPRRSCTSTSRLPPSRRQQARVDRGRRARPPAGCSYQVDNTTSARHGHAIAAAGAQDDGQTRRLPLRRCAAMLALLTKPLIRDPAESSASAAIHPVAKAGSTDVISSSGKAELARWQRVELERLSIGTDRTKTAPSSAALCARTQGGRGRPAALRR